MPTDPLLADPTLKRLLIQNAVTLERKTVAGGAGSGYGRPSYAASVPVLGRVTFRRAQVRSQGGDEVQSEVQFTFLGDLVVGFDDRFTLPDGSQPPIVAIDRIQGTEGTTVETVVWF